ncbi:carbohydrate ABC transporter permease [[Acholeplasma] multilocale]|uniref:carbohydrate ABC transporter permease n=1 Tax=[Acholeplasma] multilocale TaxID=264638 RepID=UPI00047B4E85|nr:carbohydrate ABC transporter permease [[Acholeplasma] multilocale]
MQQQFEKHTYHSKASRSNMLFGWMTLLTITLGSVLTVVGSFMYHTSFKDVTTGTGDKAVTTTISEGGWIAAIVFGVLILVLAIYSGYKLFTNLKIQKSYGNSLKANLNKFEIDAKYSNIRDQIRFDHKQKMREATSRAEIKSLRNERHLQLVQNDFEWAEELFDISSNKLTMTEITIKFNLIGKHRRNVNYVNNFGFNRYVYKKKLFTASMAGEVWWKQAGILTVRTLFLSVMAIIVIFPFYWMISISFRSVDEIRGGLTGALPIWPSEWTTAAYDFLFNNPEAKLEVSKFIANSFVIAIISMTTQIIASLLAGYGLSHYNTRGKEVLIVVILATMMLPGEALLIGQYMLATTFNWQNTLPALFVPFIGNAFTIYMFKNAFDGVNNSIKRAAKVDGLSTFKFFWKVAIPLVRATIFTSALMGFIASWNSVLWPTMVLKSDSEWMTLPMLLWQIIESTGDANGVWNISDEVGSLMDPQNVKMASAVIAILPMFIIFVLTKKYLVKGITSNSGSKE